MYECAASGDDMTSVLVDDHGKPFDFRPDWCPIVEVKEPHGRLIDADKTIRIWEGATIEGSIKPLIDARPTVIEAEGETE